jgi:hypothetical protein
MMLPEEDPRFSQWPELAHNSAEWMEDAKRISVAGYKQVHENPTGESDGADGTLRGSPA